MVYCSSCMNPMEETDSQCPYCGSRDDIEVPDHQLPPGTILNNKYLVGAALGEGGFGITYIGRDLNLDMKVAIKEYYPNGYANRSATISPDVKSSTTGERREFFDAGRERFLGEARILARFSGSIGIVDVRDFFEENHTAYIVMEYLEGQNLKDYLKEKGKLTPEQAISLLMPVMESLKKVHKQGLIHRDVSPDNIMLVDGRVKLLDFGAARNVSAVANKSLSVMLKPGYAPEEQYRGRGNQGPWTDVYALCATVYKCVTGITTDDAIQRVYRDELKAPSELGIDIDPAVEAALLKGLSVLQKDRYQSIDELLVGLEARNAGAGGIQAGAGAAKVETNADADKTTAYHASSAEDELTVVCTKKMQGQKAEGKPAAAKKQETKAVAEQKKASQKKQKGKQKKIGIILLCAAAVLVAVIGISSVIKSKNSLMIAGDKVNKHQSYLSIYEETVTAEDMKNIASLKELNSLLLDECVIEDGAAEYLGELNPELSSLKIRDCTGISDYSGIGKISGLEYLYITGCGLTDEQLATIDFGQMENLWWVDLSDNQELSDLSALSGAKSLSSLKVDHTAVADFSALSALEGLYELSANSCGITDISTLTNEGMNYLYLNDNQIADIAALNKFTSLSKLEMDNNLVSDLSPLSAATELTWLQINDNRITSLTPLAAMDELRYLYVNHNQLTNLDGLENALELKEVHASGNMIENINGITNCTILEEFNINGNSVSDISLLQKSAATLKRLHFNDNLVSDISALQNTVMLEYVGFERNKVTTLDALLQSVELVGISADHNEIVSVEGLENSTKLDYIYLAHNQIGDMSVISRLISMSEDGVREIDLSSNNITLLSLPADKECEFLAVYNNPIQDLSDVAKTKGDSLMFSYVEGMELAGFGDAFDYFTVIDCPKDKQISVENGLKNTSTAVYLGSVTFSTVEEADQMVREGKEPDVTGEETE